ncbi:MAG: MBL fold metallo-hydrolase [Methanobrevibacter sp.]|uniref:MBL fold metallo-hydrolase n=1 Tax=Methanobrevibacter sp. TaxID=66852 RepID=UPI0026E0F426|nr:MBL fold metallo-hydrolase [Methanobrevibacter sp.]MDO5848053.1 MBL fold metallo-hydrolase [Methanobrevibacter sp.]
MIIDNVICIPSASEDSNYFVIDKEILVDTGTGQHTDYLYSKLKEYGIEVDDIKMIVNTHCHYDHVGGNKDFPNAKVAIGDIDGRSIMKDDENTCSRLFGHDIERCDVDIFLKEGDKISTFEVIDTPGHSAGGICLWDGKTLISGDTIFAHGGIGRMDIGGSYEDMKKSVGRLKELDVENILPGHGPIVEGNGKAHINASYNYINSI